MQHFHEMNKGDQNGLLLHPSFPVDDLDFAACLAALGFKLRSYVRIKGDGVDDRRYPGGRLSWDFEPFSQDGRYTISSVIRAWRDDDWLIRSDDPLAYVVSAFRNRRDMAQAVSEDAALVSIRQGRRWACIREDCTAAAEARAIRHLAKG